MIKEKEVQTWLHSIVGGEMEVQTHYGRIDILSNNYLVEVKEAKGWKSALGQVLCYANNDSLITTNKRLVVALFDKSGGEFYPQSQINCLHQASIEVWLVYKNTKFAAYRYPEPGCIENSVYTGLRYGNPYRPSARLGTRSILTRLDSLLPEKSAISAISVPTN
jgi:hypothetical protein